MSTAARPMATAGHSPSSSSSAPATKGAQLSSPLSSTSGVKPVPTLFTINPSLSTGARNNGSILGPAMPGVGASIRKTRGNGGGSHFSPRPLGLTGIAASLACVDTNTASYARTDPFSALNALLKLFSLLPTRPGTHAYRLTPAEHTLSTHLLTIIEPFVGLSPAHAHARRALVRQPTEILDAIVGFVDAKRDLANLGVTCRRMYDVIFPRHFDYRVVRAKPSNVAVWSHLAAHRSLAQHVRRLVVLDERAPLSELCVPRSSKVLADTDLDSSDDELGLHMKHERYLLNALVKIAPGLTSFRWECTHSTVSLDAVWPVLLTCPNLKEVEVSDNLMFAPILNMDEDNSDDTASEGDREEEEKLTAKHPKNVVLPSLASVALTSPKHTFGTPKHPSLNKIHHALLSHTPNLESLSITYTPRRGGGAATASNPLNAANIPAAPMMSSSSGNPRVDDLLLTSRWPHLRALTLTNLSVGGGGTGRDVAFAFLAAHDKIEVLHLDVGRGLTHGGHSAASTPLPGALPSSSAVIPVTTQMEPGTLPHLRELHASKEVATLILSCPSANTISQTRLRPLETLRGPTLTGMPYDAAFLHALRPYGFGSSSLSARSHGSGYAALKKLELGGWSEMDDLRRVVECVPKLVWFDVGKRMHTTGVAPSSGPTAAGGGRKSKSGTTTVMNVSEWAILLSGLPELTTFHGACFFYEVASESPALLNGVPPSTTSIHHSHGSTSSTHLMTTSAAATTLSTSDKSKVKKNKGVASLLAWKCPKLRRLDHWDGSPTVGAGGGGAAQGKIIVLVRPDGGGGGEAEVRYEVRRAKV